MLGRGGDPSTTLRTYGAGMETGTLFHDGKCGLLIDYSLEKFLNEFA